VRFIEVACDENKKGLFKGKEEEERRHTFIIGNIGISLILK